MKKPGIAAHIICTLLAMLLTMTFLAGNVLVQAWRIANDRDMYLNAGKDVTESRMAQISADIEAIAKEYTFDPHALDNIITADFIRAQDEAMTDWLISLLHGEMRDVPSCDITTIEEAVRADELFRENTSSVMRKIIARDKVAGSISVCINEAVLPLRTSVLRLGMTMAASKVNISAYVNAIPRFLMICLAAAVVLAALIALILHRKYRLALVYLGSSMVASMLIACCIIILVCQLNIPALCAEMSPLFSAQISSIGLHLLSSFGGIAFILMFVGWLLILFFQLQEGRRRRI